MTALAALCVAFAPPNADPLAGLNFRPPAIPLITTDPFMQVWIRGNTSTAPNITHWTGQPKTTTGLLRVDGTTYRYLGNGTEPPLAQRSVKVYPTRTIFELELPGVLALTLTFLTPMFTDDQLRLSRPVYYIQHTARSLDGAAHKVQLYFAASAEHTINDASTPVAWSAWERPGLHGVQLGAATQKVLGSKGDFVNLDWGHLHLASPAKAELYAGSANASRKAFAATGTVPATADARQPRACSDDLPALATAHDLGSVTAKAVEHTVLLAYDDIASVYYFGSQYKALWTQTYADVQAAIAAAAAEEAAMQKKSEAHDLALLQRLQAAGGAQYAALGALSYRQTLAATKLVWNSDRKVVWNFLKEISTNGDMQTMDVIYPASPMLLDTAPELLQLLLVPVLAYANNETWIKFSDPYSPHQLGTYPIANDTTARQERMPLENSGNMILMLLGIVQRTQDASWLTKYWPLLASWADELVLSLPFPANQICTDDFTGPLANNTNLGAKGIVALTAFSELCALAGAQDCKKYAAKAVEYAGVWQQYAYTDTPSPHYKMSYNPVKGVTDSWSIKYNLLWQKILKLDGPFPQHVIDTEVAYYKSKANDYGIPMDPRHTYVKTDWLSWAAAMDSTDAGFHEIFDPIFKYTNETASRYPFTDLYYTDTGKQVWGSFIARPVIGGLFAKMLV